MAEVSQPRITRMNTDEEKAWLLNLAFISVIIRGFRLRQRWLAVLFD